MHRPALWVFLVLLSAVSLSAHGADRLFVVEGEVRIAGTRTTVPGATISFSYGEGPRSGIVTDHEGRFRWTPPATVSVTAGPDGSPAGDRDVMIQDMGSGVWTWDLVSADPVTPPVVQARQGALEKLRKPAKARWRATEQGPRLILECLPFGEVEVLVRGPDGAAVVDQAVRVYSAVAPHDFFSGGSGVEFRGRTDGAGTFRLRWYEGVLRLHVLVPDIGFGSTGTFEVLPGKTTRASLPPLARFARVEGTVDPKLLQPGLSVGRLPDPITPRVWERGQAELDDQGRFVLTDTVPGTFEVAALAPGKVQYPRPNRVRVRVEPGQTLRGIVIRPTEPANVPQARGRPSASPAEAASPVGGPRPKQDVVWVEGTARDAAGRGVAEAAVAVRTAYSGGVRMYERVEETTTDAQGHYRISGPLLDAMISLVVIVHARGRLPVVAYAPAPSAATPKRAPLDVTLPEEGAHGTIRVRVLKDGKPHPGASVQLVSEGVTDLGMWAAETGKSSPASRAMDSAFYPRATTGADGRASFANLFPGTYQLDASSALPPGAVGRPDRDDRERGHAQGIGVAAGQVVETEVALYPPSLKVPIQIVRPDDAPVVAQTLSLSLGLRSPSGSTMLKLDDHGVGTYAFSARGLWAVDVRFRDTPLQSFPVDTEPFYQAEALLPVSPSAALPEPIVLKGTRRERGGIRAELRDADGKPVRGSVMIVTRLHLDRRLDQAASTDAQGVARFADLPHGRYLLRGSIDGLVPATIPGPGPLPEDDALVNQVAFADEPVVVEPGIEARVVLQPRRVGYIRGTLKPPAERNVADYRVLPPTDPITTLESGQGVDAGSGTFVSGPYRAGRVTLRMVRVVENDRDQTLGDEVVEIPAGGVARVELHPPDAPEPAKGPSVDGPGRAMLGMGGVTYLTEVPPGTGGTVFLADGATPAFGARGLLIVPGQAQRAASAVSDGAGKLSWRGRWVSSPPRRRDGGPAAKPSAVVWLPGRSGATVVEVEPGQPFRAVLPAPLEVRGSVTLAGRPSAGADARLRVFAAHQGRGDLDAALSLETTADAQGQFALRGVTPGRYQVQAARDGIWLSPSVIVDVNAANPPGALTLDIPEPGAPIALEVVDREGRPVPGRSLTLARPEGPLAELWPSTLRTDTAGRLTLWGLEAGTHSLRIDGETNPRKIEAPAAGGVARAPRVVRLVCDQAQ